MQKSVLALAVLMTASMASATNLFTDGFNYTAGAGLKTNSPPWQNATTNQTTNLVSVATGSLSYPGLPSVGNSIQMVKSSSDTPTISFPTPVSSGTVYYSMILQINGAPGTGQAFFAGFDDLSLQSQMNNFVSGAALVAKADGLNSDLGIAAPGNNNNTKKYSPTSYSSTDILFVVGSYTFNTTSTHDDVMNLYVFANGDSIPTSVPATPTATATTASTNTDLTSISRFYFRNNSGEPSSILADELRIGTTWQDILPLVGDANINGRIDGDDYALIDRGYARYLSGDIAANSAAWTDGDFNLDHVVDASDYMLIDQSLLSQGGALSPDLLAERESQFGDGYVSALLASVPEPASLGLLGALGLFAGRRKRA